MRPPPARADPPGAPSPRPRSATEALSATWAGVAMPPGARAPGTEPGRPGPPRPGGSATGPPVPGPSSMSGGTPGSGKPATLATAPATRRTPVLAPSARLFPRPNTLVRRRAERPGVGGVGCRRARGAGGSSVTISSVASSLPDGVTRDGRSITGGGTVSRARISVTGTPAVWRGASAPGSLSGSRNRSWTGWRGTGTSSIRPSSSGPASSRSSRSSSSSWTTTSRSSSPGSAGGGTVGTARREPVVVAGSSNQACRPSPSCMSPAPPPSRTRRIRVHRDEGASSTPCEDMATRVSSGPGRSIQGTKGHRPGQGAQWACRTSWRARRGPPTGRTQSVAVGRPGTTVRLRTTRRRAACGRPGTGSPRRDPRRRRRAAR